jgi:hypothetical protein
MLWFSFLPKDETKVVNVFYHDCFISVNFFSSYFVNFFRHIFCRFFYSRTFTVHSRACEAGVSDMQRFGSQETLTKSKLRKQKISLLRCFNFF